jgi:hypothetical protein
VGDDRLRAELMATRHEVGTWLERDDVEHAVPGTVGPPGLRRNVLLVWVPGTFLLLMAGKDPHKPAGILEEMPRPVLPEVHEGMRADRWTVGHQSVRVHRGWRAVASWVEK